MGKIKTLPEEEIRELVAEAKNGSEEAKERLVKNYTRVIRWIVRKRFINAEHSVEDLVSVGIEGLLRSIYNFDEGAGVKFSTYMTRAVSLCISRFCNSNGIVSITEKTRRLAFWIKNQDLEEKSPEVIIETLGLEKKQLDRVCIALSFLGNGLHPLSTDIPRKAEEGRDPDGRLEDHRRNNDLNGDHWLDRITLKREVEKLPKIQQRILRLNYEVGLSYPEIGKVLGITAAQVGTRNRAAIATLREVFLSEEEIEEIKLKEKRKPFKRMTPEQKEKAIKLLKETTLTYDEIGGRVGVTHSPISRLAKEHRPKEIIEANRKRVHQGLVQYKKDRSKKLKEGKTNV
ncbi:RNA polymerase sigma factor [Bacillus phage vB_BsuM-Goe27]|nr:RNA polymerase sigma factor [Bacillus phage vB_BsuM-Goe27]